MANLFLVRHGITSANQSNLFQGITDNPLSEEGFKQADCISEYLNSFRINHIYSSPLSRAIATASPFCEYKKMKMAVIPEFHEVNCGEWEGMSVEDIKSQQGEILLKWLLTGNCKTPGGESLFDVSERIKKKLLDIASDTLKNNHNNVIFSHGAFNRVALCILLNLPVEKSFCFEQKNACINAITLRENFPPSLSMLNYIDHLKE